MENIDIGLITVKLPERRSAFRLLEIDSRGKRHNNQTYWFSSIFSERLNRNLSLALCMIGEQGNNPAVLATNRFIESYAPSALFLVGIAGGLKGKVDYYDVIASEHVYYYEPSRLEEGQSLPRPDVYTPPYDIFQDLAQYDNDKSEWHDTYARLINGGSRLSKLRQYITKKTKGMISPVSMPRLHRGVIASGEKLVANGRLIDELRIERHEKIRCIDMEAAGFAGACSKASRQTPWLVIRGVSDFGGKEKIDDTQYQASCAAMAFFKVFISKGLSAETIEARDRENHDRYISELHSRGHPSDGRIEALPRSITQDIKNYLEHGAKTTLDISKELGISVKMAENILSNLARQGIVEEIGCKFILKNGSVT